MVGCIHGGASLPPSNGAYKRFVWELNAVISTPPKPLEWSGQVITFDPADHPSNVAGVGALPLIVSPVIHNFRVTKMLVDGGSSINLRTAKNAVVRKRRISDVEHDGLRAEVLLVPEHYRKSNLPQQTSGIPVHALKRTHVLKEGHRDLQR